MERNNPQATFYVLAVVEPDATGNLVAVEPEMFWADAGWTSSLFAAKRYATREEAETEARTVLVEENLYCIATEVY